LLVFGFGDNGIILVAAAILSVADEAFGLEDGNNSGYGVLGGFGFG